MIEEVSVNYASAAQAKGIELLSDIGPDVPAEVCGDPLRLRQVVSNLVNNAVKFTKEGEVVVQVRLRQQGPGYAALSFRVWVRGGDQVHKEWTREAGWYVVDARVAEV